MAIFVHSMLHTEQKSLNLFSTIIKVMKNIVLQHRAELETLASKRYQQRIPIDRIQPYLESGLIKLITGPRRAGKSVFSLQMLAGKNYAYLNFDDDKLLGSFDEDSVMQTLSEVYPEYDYLLLDELQNLKGWDKWASKLYRKGINLIITGSNANLLSSEMATLLTGRYLEIHILPFSLKETLQFRNIDTEPVLPSDKAILMNAQEDFMVNGGFPEVINSREIEKNYLGALYDAIILKDIARRHNVRKIQDLYNLGDYLITNYCNPLSYNNIASDLDISVNTAKSFCGYFEEPYLFYFLPRFNKKLKIMNKAAKKVYVVDNGFIMAKSFEQSHNYGRQLENMVFSELLHRGYRPGKSMFYYQDARGKETDFALMDGFKVTELIQVSYDISSAKTLKRELSGLVSAAKDLKVDKLTLVTWYKNGSENIDGKTISIKSVASFSA